MAVTTTPRLLLPRWSAGTDPLRRTQLDSAFANLELYAGRFEEGALSARPAAGIRDRYYMVTDAGARILTRDTGTSWEVIGAMVTGGATDKLAAGQSAALRQGRAAAGNPGTLLYEIDAQGQAKFPNLTGSATRIRRPWAQVGIGSDINTGAGSAEFSVGWTGAGTVDGVTLGSSGQLDHFIIAQAGVYRIALSGRWGSGGTGNRIAKIVRTTSLDGAKTYLAIDHRPAWGGGNNSYNHIYYEGPFEVGDYIWPTFQQDSGVTQTLQSAAGTWVWIEWSRPWP